MSYDMITTNNGFFNQIQNITPMYNTGGVTFTSSNPTGNTIFVPTQYNNYNFYNCTYTITTTCTTTPTCNWYYIDMIPTSTGNWHGSTGNWGDMYTLDRIESDESLEEDAHEYCEKGDQLDHLTIEEDIDEVLEQLEREIEVQVEKQGFETNYDRAMEVLKWL